MLSSALISNVCHHLQRNPTTKTLGVEILGINLPRTALVRSKDEAVDVGFNEFGNTVGFFGGLYGGSALLRGALKKAGHTLTPNSAVPGKGRIMLSLVLVPALAGFMAATPFMRNAFTAWRSGTTDFADLIQSGVKTRDPKGAQRVVRENLENAGLLIGGALGIGALAAAVVSKRNVTNLPQLAQKFWKAFSIGGPKATQLSDLQFVAYWGLPAYAGAMAASRDGYELKEQLLKTVNFVALFLAPSYIVGKLTAAKNAAFAKALPALYPKGEFSYEALSQLAKKASPATRATLERVKSFQNGKILAGFGATALLMAIIPTLVNIHLTQQRLARSKSVGKGPVIA